jgi:glycosyltransferase involved in cell wall biosynthesis
MKKKLLVITSDYFHAVGHRIHHLIKPLEKEFDVKIITINSEFYRNSIPKLLVGSLSGNLSLVDRTDKDILVIRAIPMPIVNFLLLCVMIRKFLKKNKADICLTIGSFAGVATFLSKLKCPTIYEDTDRFEYFRKSKLLRFRNRIMEHYCIRKATYVISTGYSLAESARQIRGDDIVACIPNGVDYELFSESYKDMRRENTMIYVGTLSDWCGLDLVIRAIPDILKRVPDIKLLIVGEGEFSNELKKMLDKMELNHCVRFLGKRQYIEIPKILSECKIGLATYPQIDLMQYAFTLKLIEYMSSGLPVITTNVGDSAQIIKDSDAGYVVDYNTKLFSKAVIELIENENLWHSMSENGMEYARKFDWASLASLEISVLNHVLLKNEE